MKIVIKHIFGLLIAISLGMTAHAQSETTSVITGRVLDSNNKPLAGVSVFSQKANKFTITDAEGNYKIEVGTDDYLTVDEQGYDKKFVSVLSMAGKNDIVVVPWSEFSDDKKVKISGGTQKFDRLTGAAIRISGEELRYSGAYNVTEALTGRVGALSISAGNSKPNEPAWSTSLRGGGMMQVVDGARSATTDMNVNEIDDLIILKDGAATSLWGPTGSNGALIITTKAGQEGESSITAKYSHGIQQATFLSEVMDGLEYAKFYDQALVNDGLAPRYGDEAYAALKDGSNPMKYPNVDYYDEFLKPFSSYNRGTVDFAGGGRTAQYYTTLDIYTVGGLEEYNTTDHQRIRLRSNLLFEINRFLDMEVSIGGTLYNDKRSTYDSNTLFSSIRTTPSVAMPLIAGYDEEDGEPIFGITRDFTTNLLAETFYNGTYERANRFAFSKAKLGVDLNGLTQGLTFDVAFNLQVNNGALKNLSPSYNTAYVTWGEDEFGEEQMNLVTNAIGSPDNSWGTTWTSITRDMEINGGFHYDRSFGTDHQLTADLYMSRYNQTGSDLYLETRQLFGGLRANYMYKDKYVLEGSITTAGTSILSEDNRFGTFYSGGAAWIASKEDFLKDVSWLDYLKVRGNFTVMGQYPGQMESDNSSYYLYLTTYCGYSGQTFGVESATKGFGSYGRAFTGAPLVTWPMGSSFSAGFDATMFNNHLDLQVNYFGTSDYNNIIRSANLFPMMGGAYQYMTYQNYSDTYARGVDFDLSWKNRSGDFSWILGANGMYRKWFYGTANEVTYPDSEWYRNSSNAEGGLIKGFKSVGVLDTQAKVDAYNATYTSYFGHVQLGDLGYIDQNGDNVIDNRDKVEIGKSPRFYYGMYGTLRYKNLALNVRGQGVAGGQYHTNRLLASGASNYLVQQAAAFPASTDLPRASALGSSNNSQTSDFWLYSSSYFNLKTVSLTYSLPTAVAKKIACKNVDVFLISNNIGVLTASENDFLYMPSTNKGYSEYPVMRTLELGIDLTF